MRPSAFISMNKLVQDAVDEVLALRCAVGLGDLNVLVQGHLHGIWSKLRSSVSAIFIRIISLRAIRSLSQLLAFSAMAFSCSSSN
jgi:hypothetical protein